jgi:para-aminobenzoate synthetase component I
LLFYPKDSDILTHFDLDYQSTLAPFIHLFDQDDYCLLFDSCADLQTYDLNVQKHDLLMAKPLVMLEVDVELNFQRLALQSNGQYKTESPKTQSLDLELAQLSLKKSHENMLFDGGLAGALSYDFGAIKAGIELAQKSTQANQSSTLPTALMGQYAWALLSNHEEKTTTLIFNTACPDWLKNEITQIIQTFKPALKRKNAQPSILNDIHSQTQYQNKFQKIQDYIQSGDCYQINLTRCFQGPYTHESQATEDYLHLRQHSPTPFAGFVNAPNFKLLSLSPERFIRCQQGKLETRPIKGTRPRDKDPIQDERNKQRLLNSEKDRSENLMIVDLLRNDLGRLAQTGSVNVPELFSIETYPNVFHLVSSIEAQLKDNVTPIQALIDASPGGSITGAPKKRAMQIIEELEEYRRDYYCGSLFYAAANGNLDSSILIRTLLVQAKTITAYAGGGIVVDSTWQDELQESDDKIGNLLRGLSD